MHLTARILLLGLLATSVGTTSADDKRTLNEPPEGFTAIFNGKDLSGWRGGNYNPYKLAEQSEEEQAAFWKKGWEDVVQHWTAENGDLVNDGHGVYLTTEKEYSNYEFWIDYKTVAKADSGIYLKATPQVQIWDFTKEGGKWGIGADKGSGGLWNNNKGNPGKDPLVLADKPFGEWNSFRVRQIGARTWVQLNGKLVVDGAIHDNYWQTETGAIMVANYAAMDVRPGSMGRPIPGVEIGILDGEYNPVPNGEEGYLAVRPGWPSMFHTYWNNLELYNSKFIKGWYISGDQAKIDEDGYIWFVGRADDVINTAGHLVGPFEVESVLIEHPAVAEAAVIGIPDALAMEVVKGFVSLKDGFEPTEALRREILGHGRKRLQAIAPRSIEFRSSLPKTRSGKIMRRLLKAEELGLPLGDTSGLEDD